MRNGASSTAKPLRLSNIRPLSSEYTNTHRIQMYEMHTGLTVKQERIDPA